MSARKQRHRKHANPFTLRHPVPAPDWRAIFEREAPMAIDIGFGPGRFLLALAEQHPEWNVVGLEIRQHLVDGVLAEARARDLHNLHALLANANLHLVDLVPPRSLAFVSVNFPDPWFKNRHHKRRVLNASWLPVLLDKMRTGAELHFMSDYDVIAEETRSLLEGEPRLVNLAARGEYATASTTGIETEREIKHTRRGAPIYRLHYRLVDAALSTKAHDGTVAVGPLE